MKKLITIITTLFIISCSESEDIPAILQVIDESTRTETVKTVETIHESESVYVGETRIGEFVNHENGAYIAKTDAGYYVQITESPWQLGYEYTRGPIYHTTDDCSGDSYTDYRKSESVGFFTDGDLMMFHKATLIASGSFHYEGESTCYTDVTMRELSKFEPNNETTSGVGMFTPGEVTLK
ncbi:hypothetical protein GWN42_31300 [candidate division KSB1 bacterium]|nr:hypothetical protein [Phycisphaerae bacterium]NIQ92546.1 hypothetical protein [Deltaproteobacteria bacterium]NIV97156.1 hypothetical protein [candidate division KSB1 bacterium]